MYAVAVTRNHPPIFPDSCVVCGRPFPSQSFQIKAAYTERRLGFLTAIAGEWGADVPACEPCGSLLRSQHRRRFLIAFACISIGTLVAVVVVPEAAGWWRTWAMSAIVFGALLAFFAYERLDPRPISLSINGASATFSFCDAMYAAEFERLNREYQAVSDARESWKQGRAPVLHVREVYSDRPLIDPSGLYINICWDEDYARAFNEEVRRLLEAHGVPEWAPGHRLPDQERCLVLLEQGLPYEQYRASSRKEERLVAAQIQDWAEEHGVKPELFVRIDQLDLLLLGGSTGSRYRIDVLDLAQHVWMWLYEPDRRPGPIRR